MKRQHRSVLVAVVVPLVVLFLMLGIGRFTGTAEAQGADAVRYATFNASLNRNAEGELLEDLQAMTDTQIQNVAEIIQRANPDVLLINEFDYEEKAQAVELFKENYLEVGQGGAAPIFFPYHFVDTCNTGVPSGHDLNNNGQVGGPDDALGFGFFPGQYCMVVYSKYPIITDSVRTFQTFKWEDMPGALLPISPTNESWYSEEELDILPLSSKSHWDVPVDIGGKVVHILAAHPTPPVFDGPEDRNGRRNYDEIRFWDDYITPGEGDYIYDDAGTTGGLAPNSHFVIVGDYNSDPFDGDSLPGAAQQMLENPLVNTSVTPSSEGAVEQSEAQGGVNAEHEGNPAYDTADFNEPPGNIRVDYVLPSRNLAIQDARVFWPTTDDPNFDLVGTFPFPSSDHRLVWVDAIPSDDPTAVTLNSVAATPGAMPPLWLLAGAGLAISLGTMAALHRRRR